MSLCVYVRVYVYVRACVVGVQMALVDATAEEEGGDDAEGALTPAAVMPHAPLQRLEATRDKLSCISFLNVIPAMMQYTLNASDYAPPLEACQHEDRACQCGEVPPPACVLLFSALCFILSVEILLPVPDSDTNTGIKTGIPVIQTQKMIRGREIYVFTLQEISDMIQLKKGHFYDMLRLKIHHFRVTSLSSDDVDVLKSFFKKYSFCFHALRTTTDDDDETILEFLLEREEHDMNAHYNPDSEKNVKKHITDLNNNSYCNTNSMQDDEGLAWPSVSKASCVSASSHIQPHQLSSRGLTGPAGASASYNDMPPSIKTRVGASGVSVSGVQSKTRERTSTSTRARPGTRPRTRVTAAGDKKEVFDLFRCMASFLHQSVSYRQAVGFRRPIFLTKSATICELLLKHPQFRLNEYLAHHLYKGLPVLHHAVLRGNLEVVALLLKLGGQVNIRSYEDAWTPLHVVINKLSPVTSNSDLLLANSSYEDWEEGRSALLEGSKSLHGGHSKQYTTYNEESLLLDLGSDVRLMSTSLTHLNASTSDVAMKGEIEYKQSSGCSLTSEMQPNIDIRVGDDDKNNNNKEKEEGLYIITPQVVIAHLSTSDSHLHHQDKNFAQEEEEEEGVYVSAEEREEELRFQAEVMATATLLLEAGADISARDTSGWTPFGRVRATHPALCEQLQQVAARALSPIHLALIANLRDEELLFIIGRHASLSGHATPQDKLPLHLALEFQRSGFVVEALLQHFPQGARAPFARHRKTQTIKIVNNQRTLIDEIITEYQLPFYYAVEKKMPDDVLKILLAYTLPVDIFASVDEVADVYGYHFEHADPLVHQYTAGHGDAWAWVLAHVDTSPTTTSTITVSENVTTTPTIAPVHSLGTDLHGVGCAATTAATGGPGSGQSDRGEEEGHVALTIAERTQRELVSYIVEKYVRLVDGLAYCRSREGAYAIALATPACRCVPCLVSCVSVCVYSVGVCVCVCPVTECVCPGGLH